MHARRVALVVSLVSLLVSLPVSAVEPWQTSAYRFVMHDIPHEGVFGQTSIADLNQHGEFVVTTNAHFHATPLIAAAVVVQGVRVTEVGCPGGATVDSVEAINRWAQIVQTCRTATGTQGALFTVGRLRNPFQIFVVPNAARTMALGVNDRAQVVGSFLEPGSAIFRGWRWANRRYTTFDAPFPAADGTMLTGINYAGTMVGAYFDLDRGDGHAFLLKGGVYTPIEIAGVTNLIPQDINDTEQIVLTGGIDDNLVSFLWDDGVALQIVVPDVDVLTVDMSGITNAGELAGRVILANHEDPAAPLVVRGVIASPLPPALVPTPAITAVAAQAFTTAAIPAQAVRRGLRLARDGCEDLASGLVAPQKLRHRCAR